MRSNKGSKNPIMKLVEAIGLGGFLGRQFRDGHPHLFNKAGGTNTLGPVPKSPFWPFNTKAGNNGKKGVPHQGAQECARRREQMGAGW